ncbi:TatD family hydrolase [Colwelliaceae bacterium BS250]
MFFTDSHCHLDFKEFNAIRAQLINECAQHNIHRFIVPGITAKSWSRVIELASHHSNIHACLGLHPWWINKASDEDLITLENLLVAEKIVAVGEIGIDGAFDNIEQQTTFFIKQLAIANKFDKPVVIHHRKSHHLIQPILKANSVNKAGVIHAFSGNYQQAKAYLDLGFKLGIGGTITYERAHKTRDAIKKIPLESILLETDAPAMPLAGFQGEINSPLKITNVFEQLCALRNEQNKHIANQIEQNVEQLFTLR